ncbi:MAG TPA: AbrB family transcriptional regulator [Thermoleophilaceae bacterium]|nr:AbrB family transcriptional regulator [Thermoleophilaceae bacterium]
MRRAAALIPVGLATFGAGYGLKVAGLPSSYLFAALLVGLAVALTLPARVAVPRSAFVAAQAVTGVALGAFVRSSALRELAHAWLPVTLVSAATLGVCILGGALLARFTALDPPTAQLGTVAGGASGIVAMADDLGADARIVAFMQYLRVLVVVLLTPVFLALLFPGHHSGQAAASPLIGGSKDWLLTIGIAAAGVAISRLAHMTAGTLLVPMVAAAAVVLAVPDGEFVVPQLAAQTAFALIGLQVGLRFTMHTVRLLGRLLVPVLMSVVGLLLVCFGLGVILHFTTSNVSMLDAYLATTPGGLFAVLAVAFGAGANTTFILAVQGLRILVMVLLAPLVVRRLTGDRRTTAAAAGTTSA